jgi:hypothetical protein
MHQSEDSTIPDVWATHAEAGRCTMHLGWFQQFTNLLAWLTKALLYTGVAGLVV